MANIKNRTNELEDYIRQVEAKEKGKKKKLMMLSLVLLVALGGGLVPYYLNSQESALRTFNIEEMSIYTIDSIFEADSAPIVLRGNKGGKPDTISSTEAYIELTQGGQEDNLGLNTSTFSAFTDEDMEDSTTTASGAEPLPETAPKTRLPKFFFAIEGKKRVGEPIHITIVDYDENVNYTIDFGNGIKKRIRKRISYKYPKAGNFLINLIATNSTNASSIYTRSISIAPRAESKPSQSRPAIVDNNAANNGNTERRTPAEGEQENTLVATSEPEAENLFAEIIDNAGQEANNLGELSGEETGEEMAGEESVAEMQPKITGPLISAEKMPSFPGGDAAMYKFLSRKIRYPRAARESLTEGKVYLQFVVNEDGSISNIKVLRGIGYGCDEEAKRVVRQMPKWIPGEQGGQKVPVYYTMRVTFRLQK